MSRGKLIQLSREGLQQARLNSFPYNQPLINDTIKEAKETRNRWARLKKLMGIK